jgi:hypothetical protein
MLGGKPLALTGELAQTLRMHALSTGGVEANRA